jgi:hypothetical protein
MFLIIIFNSIFNFASRDQNPGSTYALKCPISGFIMLLHSVAPHCLYAIWDHYICDSSFFLIPLFYFAFLLVRIIVFMLLEIIKMCAIHCFYVILIFLLTLNCHVNKPQSTHSISFVEISFVPVGPWNWCICTLSRRSMNSMKLVIFGLNSLFPSHI